MVKIILLIIILFLLKTKPNLKKVNMRYTFIFIMSFLFVFSCDKDDDTSQKDPYTNSVDLPEGNIFYGDVVTSSAETMEYLKTFKVTKVEGSLIIDELNLNGLSKTQILR